MWKWAGRLVDIFCIVSDLKFNVITDPSLLNLVRQFISIAFESMSPFSKIAR